MSEMKPKTPEESPALKTLATCKPTEFFAQTVKIRKSVANWLTVTGIAEIRRRVIPKEPIPDNATKDQIAEIEKKFKEANLEQGKKNALAIFDAMMEEHPQETMEVLALCCFVDPERIDDYPMDMYLLGLSDMLSSRAVLRFFTTCIQWGRALGLTL